MTHWECIFLLRLVNDFNIKFEAHKKALIAKGLRMEYSFHFSIDELPGYINALSNLVVQVTFVQVFPLNK